MAIVRMTMEEAKATGRIDRAKLDSTTEEDIRRHMIEDGEDPDAPLLEPARLVWPPVAIRVKTGLSQAEFAGAIGIPVKTWRNWEHGRTRIDPAGRALLRLLADDPLRGLRVLSAPHQRLVAADRGDEGAEAINETDAAFVQRMKVAKAMPTAQDVARMRRIEREGRSARFDEVLFKHRKPTRAEHGRERPDDDGPHLTSGKKAFRK